MQIKAFVTLCTQDKCCTEQFALDLLEYLHLKLGARDAPGLLQAPGSTSRMDTSSPLCAAVGCVTRMGANLEAKAGEVVFPVHTNESVSVQDLAVQAMGEDDTEDVVLGR